ncbi:Light-independent protochlorophyllide reductase subunit N [Heliorestis convoluta]|uniref:Light-independent protochlorophyllide reductase subunit N n=2 Tax=Heliorestis convoluta TaxID=356322 RepID=A0A5Q2N8A9_9FIRM|nr:Light-independent protochlorophyllide reductase subunit N [Heliorestis convoluta]
MVYAHSRFGFAVLEESDLVAPSLTKELESVVDQVVAEWNPKVIFVMTTCSVDILKMDLDVSCKELSKKLEFPVLPTPASGIDGIFTQGEDKVLKALLPFCPKEEQETKKQQTEERKSKWFFFNKEEESKSEKPKKANLLLLGAVTDGTAQQLQWELKRLGIENVDVFPESDLTKMPVINEHTVIAPLQPYLNDTLATIRRERGATVLSTLYPIGPDGTAQFLQDICNHFNVDATAVKEREEQTWQELESQRAMIRGKKVMFLGDNLLELPLARFLIACGAEVVEVGTPYIHNKDMKAELERLSESKVSIVESPDFHRQLKRIKEYDPDLIITGLALCNPLEAMGYRTAWSIEFTFSQIHGFVNSIDLIKMFTKPLRKWQTLQEHGWN